MYRTGKIDPAGMPHTVILSDNPPPNSKDEHNLEKFMKEAREVHMALELLKEGWISGAARTETLQMKGFADIKAFTTSEEKVTEMTREFVPVVELNDEYRPASCLESFLDATKAVDVTDSVSGRKREEAIELDLTMATRSSSPKIQFPCPSTPEEATLSLGLSS